MTDHQCYPSLPLPDKTGPPALDTITFCRVLLLPAAYTSCPVRDCISSLGIVHEMVMNHGLVTGDSLSLAGFNLGSLGIHLSNPAFIPQDRADDGHDGIVYIENADSLRCCGTMEHRN